MTAAAEKAALISSAAKTSTTIRVKLHPHAFAAKHQQIPEITNGGYLFRLRVRFSKPERPNAPGLLKAKHPLLHVSTNRVPLHSARKRVPHPDGVRVGKHSPGSSGGTLGLVKYK
jgi:hypothetical protein